MQPSYPPLQPPSGRPPERREERPSRPIRPTEGASHPYIAPNMGGAPQNRHAQNADEKRDAPDIGGDGGDTLEKANKKAVRRLMAALGAVLAMAALFFARYVVFGTRSVKVVGLDRLNPQDVAQLAGLNRSSNYFNVREDTVRKRINSNRYLKYIGLEKNFPGGFTLTVEERSPAACIHFIGMQYLVAEDGMVLEKGKKIDGAEGLMAVSGLQFTDIRVGAVPTVRGDTLRGFTDLMKELRLQQMSDRVTAADFSPTGSIYLTTSDGFSVHVGNGEYMRAKIGTVRAVLAELAKQGIFSGAIEATRPGVATYRPEGKK